MSGNKLTIVWSKRAFKSLETIYKYHLRFSPKVANNLRQKIVHKVGEIQYLKQYQVDEYSKNHRRIVVSHYKVVYSIKHNEIRILEIFDSRQDPNKLEL